MKGLFLLLLVSVASAQPRMSVEGYARLRTVKIMCTYTSIHPLFGRFSDSKQGTGVFVGDNLIITEHHVIEGCQSIYVLKPQQTNPQEAVILSSCPVRDLALVSLVTKEENNAVAILEPDFAIGDKVVTIGNPNGPDFEASKSKITGVGLTVVSKDSARFVINLDCGRIRGGYSGGGIFSLRTGGLLGLIEKTWISGEYCTAEAIKAEEIALFTAKYYSAHGLKEKK